MAWKRAVAANYADLILQIRNFSLKATDTGTTVVGGSNVGDGVIYGTSSTESSVAEDFTITCTSGGSLAITGNPVPDITGSYDQSGANDAKPSYDDATNAVWWSSADGYWYNTLIAEIGTPPSTGFRLANESPVGTWEAFGTATGVPVSEGDSSPVFSVSGSVSGSQTDAVLLEPYSNGLLSLTILDGMTPYAAGDVFTIPVTSSTAEWLEDRYDATTAPTQPELIMHGIGGGTDEIYIGIRGETNSSTYWNLNLQGFTGYVDANDFTDQPGYSTDYSSILTSSTSFTFWLFMSSRSIRVVPIIGTVEEHGYLGWILPNQLPSQYDYPLFRGGTYGGYTGTVGDTGTGHVAWWNSENSDNEGVFFNGVSWATLTLADHYPHYYGSFYLYGADILGDYPLYPVTIGDFSQDKVYGDVEGVMYVPNQGGVLVSGDVLASSTEGYIVFQDTFRSGEKRVIAYDLM